MSIDLVRALVLSFFLSLLSDFPFSTGIASSIDSLSRERERETKRERTERPVFATKRDDFFHNIRYT